MKIILAIFEFLVLAVYFLFLWDAILGIKYKLFNLDDDDEDHKYRELYVRNFVSQHEAFLVNYETNIYNPNLKATDKLSDEITLDKFLHTLSSYLTKYYDEEQEA